MMSNNLIVWPLLIPLLTGIILIFTGRFLRLQRIISGLSALFNVAVSALIVHTVSTNGIQTLHMSGWIPPFGIVFVADMLAALLVLTTAVIAAVVLLYAFPTIGEAREKHYFYAFVQFLLVGVIGSFLTGDIFNLFVCFEVMLISSYALIVIGGEKHQLRESLKYLLVNVISSTFFVVTIAYLYAVTGTLNMAHLSERIAEAGQGGILTIVAVLLLVVFGLKAGLLLFFWLPGSYRVPPAAIIALFSGLLTKVGIYAIVRTFTLLFYHDPAITHTLIAWMAGATMVLGAFGALTHRDVHKVLIYNIVISVGFISLALVTMNSAGHSGIVFYLLHDMIAKTLIFMLGGLLIAAGGTTNMSKMGGLIKRYPALGWMFFVTALAIVGVPPLSGFIGKLLIVQGGLSAELYVLTGLGLASSLLALLSLMKLFMQVFWGELRVHPDLTQPVRLPALAMSSVAVLVFLVVVIGLGAESLSGYIEQAAEVLGNPQIYIDAVLKE